MKLVARVAMVVVLVLGGFACSSSVEDKPETTVEDVGGGDTGGEADVAAPDIAVLDLAGEVAPEVDDDDVPVEEAYVPPVEEYPEGPYGKVVGAIIKNHKFLDPQHSKSRSLSSLWNPDGTGEKTVLILNASAGWCSACKAELVELKKTYETYGDQGLEIWYTLFQDYEGKDATVDFWQEWMNQMKPNFPNLLDTAFELGEYFSVEATPLNMVIDLKTMKIVYMQTGFDAKGVENTFTQYLKK